MTPPKLNHLQLFNKIFDNRKWRHFKQLIVVLLLSKGHFYQDNITSIIDLASYTISVSGKIYSKQIFWQQMDWALQQKSHKAKGPLPLHLSTVYFSHLSYIQDQLRKCIHISKPLIVISSYCRWNKQFIILSFVKKYF